MHTDWSNVYIYIALTTLYWKLVGSYIKLNEIISKVMHVRNRAMKQINLAELLIPEKR